MLTGNEILLRRCSKFRAFRAAAPCFRSSFTRAPLLSPKARGVLTRATKRIPPSSKMWGFARGLAWHAAVALLVALAPTAVRGLNYTCAGSQVVSNSVSVRFDPLSTTHTLRKKVRSL